MGCTGNIPKVIDENQILNEAKKLESESISLTNNMLLCEIADSSVCKIIIDNKIGNGFFCKIKNDNNSIYLVTCYHVLSKIILDIYDEIKLKFNYYTIKLNLKEKRNVLYDVKLDFMAIEIKNEDEIKVKAFEINHDCYNYEYDNTKYDTRGIIIPCLGEDNEVYFPQGMINYSDNKRFLHNCNTIPGNSGAPIILINNIKIIGIHIGYEKAQNKNVGLFFHNILKYFKNEQNKKEVIIYRETYWKDWWRLCRDFCNVYTFFSTGKKYSEFAKVRDKLIKNRTISTAQDLAILKEWVISITQNFWGQFKVDNNLNISFKKKDSKSKILQKSKIIIDMIRKFLESLISKSTKLEDIPVRVQKIIYEYIKDKGYFPKQYLSSFQIYRIDFNFYGGKKKIQDDQVGMILAFLIISGVTVKLILFHMKDNFVEFRNYPNIDKNAKYIGSIMHYLTVDTFNNNPEKKKGIFHLMNFYRNYHIFNKAIELQDDIFDNNILKDEDEYFEYLIPESSMTEFWNLNPEFIQTFQNYVYSWACRLGKLIRLKYQKNDQNLFPRQKLEKPKNRTKRLNS